MANISRSYFKAFFIPPDEMFTEMTKTNDFHGGFLIYHLDSSQSSPFGSIFFALASSALIKTTWESNLLDIFTNSFIK